MEFENMTDKQFDVLMNSIIQIVKDSETKMKLLKSYKIQLKVKKTDYFR